MAARSTLTRTSGSVITSAWANSLRDHVVPTTTSDDVSSEGQLAANTSTDRIMVHDGSAARRLAHYSVSGRTIASGSLSATGVGSATTGQVQASMTTDADSFYTGWNGTNYLFTVPANLGGLYIIAVSGISSSAMSSGGNLRLEMAGTTFLGAAPNSSSTMSLVGFKPLTAGQTFYVTFFNNHSSSVNLTGSIDVYRMAL